MAGPAISIPATKTGVLYSFIKTIVSYVNKFDTTALSPQEGDVLQATGGTYAPVAVGDVVTSPQLGALDASITTNALHDVLASNGSDGEFVATPVGSLPMPINAQTDSYTLVLGDAGKLVTVSKATATALTIPANADVAFEVGARFSAASIGAGTCTLTAAVGVTLTNAFAGAKLTTGSAARLVKVATNTWLVESGNLSA